MASNKPISVNGIQYASLSEAESMTGINRKTLREQIEIQGNSIEYSNARKRPNYWTFERVRDIARTCGTRSEFWKKHKGAALKAQREGWLDKLYGHMEQIKQDKGYWQTLSNVRSAALECETRSEFQKKYPAAWASAHSNGWLEDIYKHMVVRKSSGEVIVRRFLLSHDIKAIPQKKFPDCKDKRPLPFDEYLPDFGILIEIQGSQHKHGWGQNSESFAYISKHDKIKKEYALKNGYKFLELWDLNERSINAKLRAEIEASIAERQLNFVLKARLLTDDEEFELSTLGQWTLEKVKEAAIKCSTPKEFQSRFPGAYQRANKMGWSEHVSAHMTRTLRPKGYWTKQKIKEVVADLKTRTEFQKKYVGAYNVASENGWLDEVCAHMEVLRTPNWTLESIKDAVKDFKKYTEFKTKLPSAYRVARINGWLDEIRGHMSPGQLPHGYWNDFDRVLEVAKQCKTKTEFQDRFGSARNAAKKHGWMALVCAHMKK